MEYTNLLKNIHLHRYTEQYLDRHAAEYIDFTYKNPTIYHVVESLGAQLQANGFHYVAEKEPWDLPPGKYFTLRNGLALAAFIVGADWTPERGVAAIGAHIDSLTVVLKPSLAKSQVEGYNLLGVAPYAGTLGPAWWDRDLGVGGRILVKGRDKVELRLVDLTPHPIAKIPTLAPHFGAPAVGPFNLETQAVPVVGYGSEPEPTEAEKKAPLYGRHSLALLRYVARLAGVEVADILLWDLQLYDVQKGTRGGLNNEFIFAPRVDDRVCSYAAVQALIESASLARLDAFHIVGLFDHEEVGSNTRTGAQGGLLKSVVARVAASRSADTGVAWANSVILSADVNHLVNPNFANVYLEHHKPVPNTGVAVMVDPNAHSTTDLVGIAFVERLAALNGDKVQYFQIRNDLRLGGTIGPYVLVQTGARTIDLGIPQLSMHSIRATLGAHDVGLGTKFFSGFFKNWRKEYDSFSQL